MPRKPMADVAEIPRLGGQHAGAEAEPVIAVVDPSEREAQTAEGRRARLAFVKRFGYLKSALMKAAERDSEGYPVAIDPALLAALPPEQRAKAKAAEERMHRHVATGWNAGAWRAGEQAAHEIADALPERWQPPEAPASESPTALAAQIERM